MSDDPSRRTVPSQAQICRAVLAKVWSQSHIKSYKLHGLETTKEMIDRWIEIPVEQGSKQILADISAYYIVGL